MARLYSSDMATLRCYFHENLKLCDLNLVETIVLKKWQNGPDDPMEKSLQYRRIPSII